MSKKSFVARDGVTIFEMEVGILVASILTVVLGIVWADTQKAWSQTYTQSSQEIAIDDHVAKLTFDSLIRKASAGHVTVDGLGEWIEVGYYASSASSELDRYSRLYISNGSLLIEHGELDLALGSKSVLQTSTICGNVTGCLFSQIGRSAHMVLTLSEGSRQKTLVSSAYPHNE